MPITREGWPFIGVALLLTAGSFALGWTWSGVVLLLLTAFMCNFFRDPEREVPQDPRLVLSPADGHVVKIVEAPADGPLGPTAKQISIFLSVFDVHVNRSPIQGRITDVKYNPGAFLPAFDDKASLQNEQNRIIVEGDGGFRVVFTQIAGLIARRIVFRKRVGDVVGQGERVGMIRFGSRTDVFVPEGVAIEVKVGQYVRGGLTVLGRRS